MGRSGNPMEAALIDDSIIMFKIDNAFSVNVGGWWLHINEHSESRFECIDSADRLERTHDNIQIIMSRQTQGKSDWNPNHCMCPSAIVNQVIFAPSRSSLTSNGADLPLLPATVCLLEMNTSSNQLYVPSLRVGST